MIIRYDRGDLGLLEHEFGDEDCVRIASPAPGKIAAVAAVPAQKRPAECTNVLLCSYDIPPTSNG